jgi:sugar-specific transcriptional regulator TrmB
MAANASLLRLMDLGLSEYEAKTYIALLGRSPATAYETAKSSGVPTSKIYEVLEKMRVKGLVLALDEDGERKRYLPQDSREFLAQQKAKLSETVSSLEEDLRGLSGGRDVSYLWNVRSRDALLDKARTMMDGARTEILLSAAGEELESLSRAIEGAGKRGIRIATVYFGENRLDLPGAIYPHPIRDTLQAEKGGRGFALVSDSAEALIGTIGSGAATEGAYSRNRGFVVSVEDYIKHDIYVMKIVRRYDAELIRRFGPNYALLRDVFEDREL